MDPEQKSKTTHQDQYSKISDVFCSELVQGNPRHRRCPVPSGA